ncbi:sulfotransferase [Rhabdochromatium marinum]|uniref:sulfotransferase n=1 Tax=Rhabdochromatium marinum TaxID=48729 RepID=UPI001904454E|nr:sulfotransferase [Rhabdochromatium marinum]MBK1649918.1 sulfotransferase family protein [Rhabdochromatium marinum]
MLKLFLLTLQRFVSLIGQSFARHPALDGVLDDASGSRTWGQSWRRVWQRRLVMLAFLPFLALVLGIHWAGFLLDEIFFRGYRRVAIREPLFVLGVPRSGTTNLHRVLAQDAQFTTFSTWESLFALSVSARKFWLGLASLDQRLGGWLARLLRWVEKHGFSAMDDVHPMTLDAPEEDYFALLPILSCFILVLPFPFVQRLWDIGQFDRRLSVAEQEAILAFYRACLQKHLYVHGPDKRLLSKNAAFAPLAGSLKRHFPEARFLICLREPERTLPSQLSSIASGLAFFGTPARSPWVRDRFIEQLKFYYLNLAAQFASMPPERCAWLSIQALREDLSGALLGAYQQLGLPVSTAFHAILTQEAEASRRYRSGHRYALNDFGLEAAALAEAFAAIYADPRLASLLRPPETSGDADISDTAVDNVGC